jgi:serine/threonine-protein kinase RsbW
MRVEMQTTADRTIRLSVPGSLEFRDVAVRVVGTACRLLRPREGTDASVGHPAEPARADFSQDEFATQVVSAFSEAFNNLAIHGYKDANTSECRIELEISSDPTSGDGVPSDGAALVITLVDWGKVYDPASYADVPDELPERGMGLFIIRSFMDEISYVKGPPNVLKLKKKWPPPGAAGTAAGASAGPTPAPPARDGSESA